MKPLLQVRNLSVRFPVRRGLFGAPREFVHAVEDVSLDVGEAETVGLVGESGCGKSTLGRAIVRLVSPASGEVLFQGTNLVPLQGAALRRMRRNLQIVFQDPYHSLDPRLTVEDLIGEALDIHRLARGAARRSRVAELLRSVGLDPSYGGRYPHEFSGGQRQRIGLARALAVEPRLIVCDEPVSALDVSVQAQIINLLQDLQQSLGIAFLFIAHDLAVVEHISRRVLVMYLGRIVESAESRVLVRSPRHPYTQALISAVPVADPVQRRTRVFLPGELPSPIHPPSGCPFHPRCPVAEPRCREQRPGLREIAHGHAVACHLVAEAGESAGGV
ncbi:MAG: oligopeptide/dipeptide ABC transporter ATP-binding protein [Verrucomicrobiota bacterium]